MRVKLRVLHGSKAGREIGISIPKFIIGRGEGAHLRPRTDVISRQHCVIRLDDGKVSIEDLKSRNGTYVNGERIEGPRQLELGDTIRVGKLEFEVLIDHGIGGVKQPKVKDVKEAAARAAKGGKSKGEDENVSSWLFEADELERTQRLADPETRQFKLSDTDSVKLNQVEGDTVAVKSDDESEQSSSQETHDGVAEEDTSVPKKKMEPGKLPKQAFVQNTKDSREAASEMLKKFFNRR